MIFKFFGLFLAYSSPRFQRSRPLMPSFIIKAGDEVSSEAKLPRRKLSDLNNGHLGRLLEHWNLADVTPHIQKYNLTGMHLARGITDEQSLTALDMTPIQARCLMSCIAEWNAVGLPEDFSVVTSFRATEQDLHVSAPKHHLLSDDTLRDHQQLENAFMNARLPRNATEEARESLSLLIEKATHANPLAAAYLSYLYHQGCPVLAVNMKEAIRFAEQCLPWLQSASSLGDPFAQCMLGEFYHLGNGVTQSYDQAARYFKLAADQSHAEGQVFLARAYLSGRGMPQNDTKAFELYSFAAKQGHVEANYKTGMCIYRGWGVPLPLHPPLEDDLFDAHWEYFLDHYSPAEELESEKEDSYKDWDFSKASLMALPYFQAAAHKGHREAAFYATDFYTIYNDEEKLEDERFKYFKIAADLGHCESQHDMGLMYESGRHNVTVDAAMAMYYFKLAAAQGHHYSASKCAEYYLKEGSNYDEKEGLRYLHIAAGEDGVSESALQLARRYETGNGVQQNLGVAGHYYRRGLEYPKFTESEAEDKAHLVRLEAEGYTSTVYSRFWD